MELRFNKKTNRVQEWTRVLALTESKWYFLSVPCKQVLVLIGVLREGTQEPSSKGWNIHFCPCYLYKFTENNSQGGFERRESSEQVFVRLRNWTFLLFQELHKQAHSSLKPLITSWEKGTGWRSSEPCAPAALLMWVHRPLLDVVVPVLWWFYFDVSIMKAT